MGKLIDLTGQVFGRLTVIGRVGSTMHGAHAKWVCKCQCGNEVVVVGNNLRTGNTQSCGCLGNAVGRRYAVQANTKHGMYHTRLYHIWHNVLQRCGAIKGASKKTKECYELRGITVCEEWRKFENFRDWALANGYADNLTIDRKDNNKDYSPNNCHWATPLENTNNRRCTRKYQGVPISDICRAIGIETYDRENKTCTKGFLRIAGYYKRYNGDLPDDIKQRYARYCLAQSE